MNESGFGKQPAMRSNGLKKTFKNTHFALIQTTRFVYFFLKKAREKLSVNRKGLNLFDFSEMNIEWNNFVLSPT